MVIAIKVGASISTSGKYALQGRQALAGVAAWLEATNARGGVRGQGLRRATATLLHYDDESSPARAISNVERLIRSDRVDILLGPYSSELTRAVTPVVAEHGGLLWNHGGASAAVHQEGCRVVGVLTPASRYLSDIFDLARAWGLSAKSVAIFRRQGSSFGKEVAEGAERAARKGQFRAVPFIYSSPSEIQRLVATLSGQGVDLIAGAGSFQEDCLLARELLAQGVKAKVCALVAAAMEEFGRALGKGVGGFLGPSQWESTLRPRVDFGPSPLAVLRRLRARGASPDYPAAQAYAACLIAQRCLEECGSAEKDALWEAACRLDCTTFFGRFKIEPATGLQVGHEMVWVQWQRGKKAIVWARTT